MSAYTNIYDAATNVAHSLRKQTATAIRKTAVDVLNEAENTPDHSQRVAWARRVLADPEGWAAKAIWSVLENVAIQADPAAATDGDVQFVTNSLVTTLMKGS